MFTRPHIVNLGLSFCLLLFAEFSIAAAPEPFVVNYDARYRGLRAEATISLEQNENGSYLAHSIIAIKLFGATVTSINERSRFDWIEDRPRPRHYEYIQRGLGSRSRSIDFNWQENTALASVDERQTELELPGLTLDELSMYTVLKQEVLDGAEDVFFDVIDRNQVEEYHYRLIGEEAVETEVGTFQALKVERVRENSERLTQLWFAPEHDMLLIKIYHRDPDGDDYEITIKDAQLNGEAVTAG
tara:strand:- start:430 stop:1161 length:732 start_codon:yes stop_codon:yes gene_type:complete